MTYDDRNRQRRFLCGLPGEFRRVEVASSIVTGALCWENHVHWRNPVQKRLVTTVTLWLRLRFQTGEWRYMGVCCA